MTRPADGSMADDDLSRQRRKREARLLDSPVPAFPALTVADVVADVLAATDQGQEAMDVPGYLAGQGHDWQTIKTVVAYLEGQNVPDRLSPRLFPLS